MSVATSHWRCEIGHFGRFFEVQNFKIFTVSDSQNGIKIECLGRHASSIYLKPTFIHKKCTFLFYMKNINFSYIFDDLGIPGRLQVGHFFLSEFESLPKNSGLNPWIRIFSFEGTLT